MGRASPGVCGWCDSHEQADGVRRDLQLTYSWARLLAKSNKRGARVSDYSSGESGSLQTTQSTGQTITELLLIMREFTNQPPALIAEGRDGMIRDAQVSPSALYGPLKCRPLARSLAICKRHARHPPTTPSPYPVLSWELLQSEQGESGGPPCDGSREARAANDAQRLVADS